MEEPVNTTTRTESSLAAGPSIRLRALAVAGLFLVCLAAAGTLASGELWRTSSGSRDQADDVPYLGITYVSLSHEIAARYGVGAESGLLVTAVSGGSPAASAKVERGDIVLAADGDAVTSGDKLIELLLGKKPGDRVALQLERNGNLVTAEPVLGTRP